MQYCHHLVSDIKPLATKYEHFYKVNQSIYVHKWPPHILNFFRKQQHNKLQNYVKGHEERKPLNSGKVCVKKEKKLYSFNTHKFSTKYTVATSQHMKKCDIKLVLVGKIMPQILYRRKRLRLYMSIEKLLRR